MLHCVRETGEGVAVALWGRFTWTDFGEFRSVVAAMDEARGRQCLLDLSGVTFIDAAAAGMLVLADRIADLWNLRLVLKAPRGQAAGALARARLQTVPAYDA